MISLLGYVVLFILTITGILSVISGLVAIPFAFVSRTLGGIVGGAATWLLVFFLWAKLFKEPLPILALLIGGVSLYYLYPKREGNKLDTPAKADLFTELIGFVIISIYFLFKVGFNWF